MPGRIFQRLVRRGGGRPGSDGGGRRACGWLVSTLCASYPSTVRSDVEQKPLSAAGGGGSFHRHGRRCVVRGGRGQSVCSGLGARLWRKLNPEQGISRQQAVSLVMRALSYKLQATGAGNSIGVWIARGETALWLRGFRDRYRIVSPHDLAVGSALRLGIVKARDDGMFSPETFLTRGQAAGLLHRSLFNPVSMREVPPDEHPPTPLDIVVGPGAREDAVEALEAQLESLGYFFGTPDKLFDRRTEEAVIGFQKVSGLNRTGVVDAGFW